MSTTTPRGERHTDAAPLPRRAVRWPVAGVGMLVTVAAALFVQLTLAAGDPQIVVAVASPASP